MKKRDANDYSFAALPCNAEVVVWLFTTMNSYACIGSNQGINGTYYSDVVLRQMLLPDIRAASGSEFFVFQ